MNAAIKLHRVAHGLTSTRGLRWLGTLVYWANKLSTSSDIDPRASIARDVFVPHATGVVIGCTAEIGARTVIMPGVVIGSRDRNNAPGRRHATVGADVVLGAGAKILGPVVIGDGARIGANAVVLSDVAPSTTVVGIPARAVPPRGVVRD